MRDFTEIMSILMAVSFLVNIVVQFTKSYIHMPTKLWCILVSLSVNAGVLLAGVSFSKLHLTSGNIILAVFSSFIIAYISMYGFDSFKDIWERFKNGENINDDNK